MSQWIQVADSRENVNMCVQHAPERDATISSTYEREKDKDSEGKREREIESLCDETFETVAVSTQCKKGENPCCQKGHIV